MMMKYIGILSILLLACKKPEERSCWKSYGSIDTISYGIDSVEKFNLYNHVTYRFFQSDERKILVIGGDHVIPKIEILNHNFQVDIRNQNKCRFLRDYDKKIEIQIYYPHYHKMYAEPTDSMIFEDTITGNYFELEIRESGGVAKLNTDLNDLRLTVSAGAGSFVVGGKAKFSTLKVQGQGFGNALNLICKYAFVYQNSGVDLLTNFSETEANVVIDGAGDVRFKGEAKTLMVDGKGVGECITYN